MVTFYLPVRIPSKSDADAATHVAPDASSGERATQAGVGRRPAALPAAGGRGRPSPPLQNWNSRSPLLQRHFNKCLTGKIFGLSLSRFPSDFRAPGKS